MSEVSFVVLGPEARERLVGLLRVIDGTYRPPLSAKTDLEAFAAKILARGKVIAAMTDAGMVGCIAFYANDLLGGTAYVPLVGVCPEAAGRHIATQLVAAAIDFIRSTGMQRIGIHTNNRAALHIYTKMGFDTISSVYDRASDRVRYYLEYVF